VIKRTSELSQGDVVNCHGMRCLVDRPLEVSKNHPDTSGVGDGKTRWTQALVMNRDEVPNERVPVSWTADWDRTRRFENTPHDGEHRWTIQGNDRATWYVEDPS
jgi:hypothetical protein